MPYYVRVDLNGLDIDEFLNDPDGPVGELLAKLSAEMTETAKSLVPLQKPWNYSWSKEKSTSYMPWSAGYTKAGIHQHMGYTQQGKLYGATNAPYGPTLFLEKPARQLHHKYAFMSTALYSIDL